MDKSARVGRLLRCEQDGENYSAYLPTDLPPDPPLQIDEFYLLLDQANIALGRLDGMSGVLPDHELFLYMYIRKEAVLSSQIEGTQSSLSDLFLLEIEENPNTTISDATEVSCYVSAMSYGLKKIKEGSKISLELIKELHRRLMSNNRGGNKMPGEFRREQNWISGITPSRAIFVPPPPNEMMGSLNSLEKFLNDDSIKLPALIKAALAHVQFETIHPFHDGNGRLGRLLITFILCAEGVLREPLLYLSLYFKSHKQTYYDQLQNVRKTGDWESWIKFFLTGVIETARQATDTAKSILDLFDKDTASIQKSNVSTAAVLTVHKYFQRTPIANTKKIRESSGLSLPTVLRALSALQELGIIQEVTGKERNKIFGYGEYLSILNKGTEPFIYKSKEMQTRSFSDAH